MKENQVQVVQSSSNYEVLQTPDGKFVRRAVFQRFSSIRPETKEQKIAMMNLLESDDVAVPMKEVVGAEIEIQNVIMNPYDSLDEDTGEVTNGVLTYLIDPSGKAYVTSSKSVYFTMQRLFTVFGEAPYLGDDTIKVQIVEKKGKQHKYVDLKVIG